MAKATIPNNESSVTPSNALQQQQQQQQQQHASSSHTDNSSSFVSVINNGYAVASREFERFCSSWGFNKRPKSTQVNAVGSTQNKYHGKRKRDSNDSNDSNNSVDHSSSAIYARIIPDENRQQNVYPLPSSTLNNNNTTTITNHSNKSLATFNSTRTLEPRTSESLSNNTNQHRHTLQFLVERPHSPPTRLKDISSTDTDQQHSTENMTPGNATTHLLNDNEITMGATSRLKSESTPNSATPTQPRRLQPLYLPSANDTAKYVNLDLLEEERLAKLERIIREAHSNATQLLSISQNSKSSRTVRFSPIIKHASIPSPRTSWSPSDPPPLVSSSYLSPRRSSPPPSSAYARAKYSLSLESPSPSPRRAAITTAAPATPPPPRIENEPTRLSTSSSSSMSRFAHDPFTTMTTSSNATWGTTPKQDDEDNIYYKTDSIPLKDGDLPFSRATSLEPFSTSSTEMKTSSPPSSSSPLIHQRLSSMDHHLFEQGQQHQQQRNIVNGHQVLPREQPPQKKLKTVDFDEEHKKTMGIIIHQIPKVTLRRTDTIRGPDGQLKPNPIWNEIYNNGKNKSRPL